MAVATVTGVAAKGTWSYRYDIPYDSGHFAVVDGVIYYLEQYSKDKTRGQAFVVDIDDLAVEVDIPYTFDFNGVTYTVTSEYGGGPFFNKWSVFGYLNLSDDEFLKYCTEYWPNDINNTLKRLNTGPLKSIDDGFFRNYVALEEVRIPNFEYIESYTFMDCNSLKTVEMPMVVEINKETFRGCTSLKSVDLHNVTSIADEAFSGCISLSSVNLPNVERLSYGCFYGCSALKECILPKVNIIERSIFMNCMSLERVVFEADAVDIKGIDLNMPDPYCLFQGCTSLRELVFNGRLTNMDCYTEYPSALPFCVFDGLQDRSILAGCTALEKLYINHDMFYQRGAINDAKDLKSLIIGNNCISYFVTDAITDCDIQEIHCMFPLPPVLYRYPKNSMDKNGDMIEADKQKCVVYVPKGCRERYLQSPYWGQFVNIVEDNSVDPLFDSAMGPTEPLTDIDDLYYSYRPTGRDNEVSVALAYYQYKGLDGDTPLFYNYHSNWAGPLYVRVLPTPMTIPATVLSDSGIEYAVTEIAPFMSYGFKTLYSADICEGITTIGDYAFSESAFVESFKGESVVGTLTLPSTLQSIGRRAFENVVNLGTITCNAMTPPELADDRFCTDAEVRSHIELNVPPEAAEAYRSTPVWRDFIVNGVQSVDEIEAEVAEGDVEYYNLQGMRVTPDRAGIYIRRTGGEVAKVIIK